MLYCVNFSGGVSFLKLYLKLLLIFVGVSLASIDSYAQKYFPVQNDRYGFDLEITADAYDKNFVPFIRSEIEKDTKFGRLFYLQIQEWSDHGNAEFFPLLDNLFRSSKSKSKKYSAGSILGGVHGIWRTKTKEAIPQSHFFLRDLSFGRDPGHNFEAKLQWPSTNKQEFLNTLQGAIEFFYRQELDKKSEYEGISKIPLHVHMSSQRFVNKNAGLVEQYTHKMYLEFVNLYYATHIFDLIGEAKPHNTFQRLFNPESAWQGYNPDISNKGILNFPQEGHVEIRTLVHSPEETLDFFDRLLDVKNRDFVFPTILAKVESFIDHHALEFWIHQPQALELYYRYLNHIGDIEKIDQFNKKMKKVISGLDPSLKMTQKNSYVAARKHIEAQIRIKPVTADELRDRILLWNHNSERIIRASNQEEKIKIWENDVLKLFPEVWNYYQVFKKSNADLFAKANADLFDHLFEKKITINKIGNGPNEIEYSKFVEKVQSLTHVYPAYVFLSALNNNDVNQINQSFQEKSVWNEEVLLIKVRQWNDLMDLYYDNEGTTEREKVWKHLLSLWYADSNPQDFLNMRGKYLTLDSKESAHVICIRTFLNQHSKSLGFSSQQEFAHFFPAEVYDQKRAPINPLGIKTAYDYSRFVDLVDQWNEIIDRYNLMESEVERDKIWKNELLRIWGIEPGKESLMETMRGTYITDHESSVLDIKKPFEFVKEYGQIIGFPSEEVTSEWFFAEKLIDVIPPLTYRDVLLDALRATPEVNDITDFILEIETNKEKMAAWAELKKTLRIESATDQQKRIFYELGYYLHTHELKGSWPKKKLATAFRSVLEESFDSLSPEEKKQFRKAYQVAIGPNVAIFGSDRTISTIQNLFDFMSNHNETVEKSHLRFDHTGQNWEYIYKFPAFNYAKKYDAFSRVFHQFKISIPVLAKMYEKGIVIEQTPEFVLQLYQFYNELNPNKQITTINGIRDRGVPLAGMTSSDIRRILKDHGHGSEWLENQLKGKVAEQALAKATVAKANPEKAVQPTGMHKEIALKIVQENPDISFEQALQIILEEVDLYKKTKMNLRMITHVDRLTPWIRLRIQERKKTPGSIPPIDPAQVGSVINSWKGVSVENSDQALSFKEKVKAWNELTDKYHEASSHLKKAIWKNQLLGIWGLDSESTALDAIKGKYIGIRTHQAYGVHSIANQDFILKYRDVLGLPGKEVTSQWTFTRPHMDRYDALHFTLNYIQQDLNELLKDSDKRAEFSQGLQEYLQWLKTGDRAPVFNEILKSIGNTTGELHLNDVRDRTFAQYLYYFHTHEEKGSWAKFKLAAAVRYKARKLYEAEMLSASQKAGVEDLFAEKFKVGTDRGLFGADDHQNIRGYRRVWEEHQIPGSGEKITSMDQFRVFIENHNQKYIDRPDLQMISLKDYSRIYRDFGYRSVEEICSDMRIPFALFDSKYVFANKMNEIEKKRNPRKPSEIKIRPQTHDEMRRFIFSNNAVYKKEPQLQIHTQTDWNRLASSLGLEYSVNVAQRLGHLDFDYYTGKTESISGKRPHRRSDEFSFKPKSHQEMREFVLSHNLIYAKESGMQIFTARSWDYLAGEFGWETASGIGARLGQIDFDYYAGLTSDLREKKVHRKNLFRPKSHNEMRKFVLDHNKKYGEVSYLQIQSSVDWDKLAKFFNLAKSPNVIQRLGFLDFDYYTGKSEVLGKKRIYRKSKDLKFKPSTHQEMREYVMAHNQKFHGEPEKQIHTSSDWDRWAVELGHEFEINLAKRLKFVDFAYYDGTTEKPEPKFLNKRNDIVQHGFVDFSSLYKGFSGTLSSISEKIGQIRAMHTLGDGNRFLPNVIRDVEGEQKKPSLISFVRQMMSSKNIDEVKESTQSLKIPPTEAALREFDKLYGSGYDQHRFKYLLNQYQFEQDHFRKAFNHFLEKFTYADHVRQAMFRSLLEESKFTKVELDKMIVERISLHDAYNIDPVMIDVLKPFLSTTAAKSFDLIVAAQKENIVGIQSVIRDPDIHWEVKKSAYQILYRYFHNIELAEIFLKDPRILPESYKQELIQKIYSQGEVHEKNRTWFHMMKKHVPVQLDLNQIILQIASWNTSRLKNYTDEVAERGYEIHPELEKHFPLLNAEDINVLKAKYMKHGFFSFPVNSLKASAIELYRDINGFDSSKEQTLILPKSIVMLEKANQSYQIYLSKSGAEENPTSISEARSSLAARSAEQREETAVQASFKRKTMMDWAPDWMWYWITDKLVPLELRHETHEKVASDPRMKGWFARNILVPSFKNASFVEETPEYAMPPELSSNKDPKPGLASRIGKSVQTFWKKHIVDVDPSVVDHLGVDAHIELMEEILRQMPFTQDEFKDFERKLINIDERDLSAKTKKALWEKFKYQTWFDHLEKENPEMFAKLQQWILLMHNMGEKNTYSKFRSIAAGRVWIERNILLEHSAQSIVEFRENFSEMISPEIAIFGIDSFEKPESQSPYHDLQQINRNRIRVGSSILSDAIKSELHLKRSELSNREVEFYHEYLENRGITVPESGKTDYLHFAIEQGFHPKIIQMLVKHGFDLNKPDRSGNTSWALWIKNFQILTKQPDRKEAYFSVFKNFRSDKKISFRVAHYVENISIAEFLARHIPEREDRKPILAMYQVRDVGYTNPVIEMIRRYNVLGESIAYSKVIEHVHSGVNILDSYFDLSGNEQRQTQLHKILEAFEREPGTEEEKLEAKKKIAEIILAAFEKNPKPGMNGRLKELALINNLRIGVYPGEFAIEADGHKKHIYDVQAEIYQRYAMVSPESLVEYPKLLDRFVYLSRQLSAPSFQKFLDAVFKLSAPIKEGIFNYYSNSPETNRNTYNRTLANQAIYAEVDVAYLRKMKEHGADFTIQNNRFIGHDVDGSAKNAHAENHHIDFMIKHVKHFQNKENARNVIRFLIDEIPGKTYRKPIVVTQAKNFGAAMREFGFTLEESQQVAEKINTRLGDSMLVEAKPQIMADIRFGYENLEIKDFTRPTTQIEVAFSKAQARDMLLNESFASNEQIMEFVNEILSDPVKKPVFEKIMSSMGLSIEDPADLLKDEKVRRFLERGRFVHHYSEPNTEEKKAMFLEYFALSIHELNGKMKNPKLYNESMTQAASPEVLMFGKKPHSAKNIALIISPLKGSKSEKILQAFNRWNTLYPARKIDTPRMWNKYHKAAALPDYNKSMVILEKEKITPEKLGIHVSQEPQKHSKLFIATMNDLRALLVDHNQKYPKDKILLQSTYEKLSGRYGYPSYITLTNRIKAIDWKYVTGQTQEPSQKLRARPSKFVVKNAAEFRDLIVEHNINHPRSKINSPDTYQKYAPKFGYMSFNALKKNVGRIDWIYVTGGSDVSANVNSQRVNYTKVAIRSELALRELVVVHNRLYPKEAIQDKPSYEVMAKKYGYPALRSLAGYIPTVDWKFVTGETDVSNATPRKSRTIYKNIKTEAQLRELISKHNATAPSEDKIISRETYKSFAEKYRLPSVHALYTNIGDAISWKYVTGQVDQPEPNQYGKRIYPRASNPGVIGMGPAAIFTPGGWAWFTYTFQSLVQDFKVLMAKGLSRIELMRQSVIWDLKNRARGAQIAHSHPEPQDNPKKKEKNHNEIDLKAKIETNLTKYTVLHKDRNVSLQEIKEHIHAYNDYAEPDQKLVGMRTLDKYSGRANIPERRKIIKLLQANNIPSAWLFETPEDYNLGKDVQKYKARFPQAKVVISRGQLWTPEKLMERLESYNASVGLDKRITDIKKWDKYSSNAKLPLRTLVNTILTNEGRNKEWLFGKVDVSYNLAAEIKAYRAQNSGKMPYIYAGRVLTALDLKQSKDAYNLKAHWGVDSPIVNAKDLDRYGKLANLPDRSIISRVLAREGKTMAWFLGKEILAQTDQSKVTGAFYQGQKITHKEASRLIQKEIKSAPPESGDKAGKPGNTYSTVIPGLPQALEWLSNGGPKRVLASVKSMIPSLTMKSLPESEKQIKRDAKTELYEIVNQLKAIQNPLERDHALTAQKERITELSEIVSKQSFESRKEMIKFLANVNDVKALPNVKHMPKEFGKFFAALQIAHLFKAVTDDKISVELFGHIIRELPIETLRFGTFSTGASIGSAIAFDIPEMLTMKIMQQHGYQAMKEIKALRGSGMIGALRAEGTRRAFVRGQVGMLAGTVTNLLIYNPELSWNEVWKQAVHTQVSFMIAGAVVRGVAVKGVAWAGTRILKNVFTGAKAAWYGSKAAGPVGIVVLAAEFIIADPINNFITKVDKNSELGATVYENMIRLEAWLKGQAIPEMRYQDPCKSEKESIARGGCYAQAAVAALQMYNISMVYWPVQQTTQEFLEKQVKLDRKSSLSQLIEENREQASEFGRGTPLVYSMTGMQDYRDNLKKLWNEYAVSAKDGYEEVRSNLSPAYVDVFKELSNQELDCETENLIDCGEELIVKMSKMNELERKLLKRIDVPQQDYYFADWKNSRTRKNWSVSTDFLDVDQWSQWSIYMAKRMGSIQVSSNEAAMVQQNFTHQVLETVKTETLFGSPDTLRRKEHNHEKTKEGYWTYAYSPNATGFGLWGNIFSEKVRPQTTVIGKDSQDLAKNVAWSNQNKKIAQNYSLDLFTKNTLSLVLPRGDKQFEPREQDLMLDLSYFYKCKWTKKNSLLSEFLVHPREFERSEKYYTQKEKIRTQDKARIQNTKYRLPTDDELNVYYAEREQSVANEQPMMFIQVYRQDETTDRFAHEPMLVFIHANGVMKRDLEARASQMLCH